jgi:hypothetical protein
MLLLHGIAEVAAREVSEATVSDSAAIDNE